MVATGYALAELVKRESPELVLLGQQSDDAGCYAVGSVVGQFLGQPALSQVSKLELSGSTLTLERQAEYGYDTLEVTLPAVISVSDSANEPRYPSLKAIMGAKKKPVEKLDLAGAGIDAGRSAPPAPASSARTSRLRPRRPPARSSPTRTRPPRSSRSSRGSTRASSSRAKGTEPWRTSSSTASPIEGTVNKNSRGAVSEAAKVAGQLGGEAHAVLVGTNVDDALAQQLGAVGASKVWTVNAPEGVAQPAR